MRCLSCGLATVVLLACSSKEPASRSGIGEPLLVRTTSAERVTSLAQFIPGPIPGTPAPADAGPAFVSGTEVGSDGPTMTINSAGKILQGQAGVAFSGIASAGVSAVALSLENLSTGYWVVPIFSLDTDNSIPLPKWTASVDFAANIGEGFHNVQYAAIDGNGNAGLIRNQKLCIVNRVPDGLQGCATNPQPPAAVISLSWDTNVDLDLQVKGPDGRLIEAKNPYLKQDAGVPALSSDEDRIDIDSNAGCVIDNVRYENLVWHNTTPKGNYGIYVNLFSACKQASVHFNVQVYTAVDAAEGTKKLKSWYSTDGMLMDFQANGGSNIGLFVTDFNFQ